MCASFKMAKRAIEACDSDISDNPQSPEVETSPGCSKRRKLAYCGAAKYPSKFKSEWTKCYPVQAVRIDQYSFFCVPCNKTISCGHQGLKDVKDHCITATHKKLLKSTKSQPSVSKLFQEPSTIEDVMRAEVMVRVRQIADRPLDWMAPFPTYLQ